MSQGSLEQWSWATSHIAAAVTLKAQNNTMNDFTNKVYSAEHQAPRTIHQIQDQITAQGQELKSEPNQS